MAGGVSARLTVRKNAMDQFGSAAEVSRTDADRGCDLQSLLRRLGRLSIQSLCDCSGAFKACPGPQRRDRRSAAGYQCTAGRTRTFHRDGLDLAHDLVEWDWSAIDDHLPRNLFGARAGTFKRHQQAG